MKKQFLLFLLTLLPLAGWAASADLDPTSTLKLRNGLSYNGDPQKLIEGTAVLPADYDTSVGKVLYAATSSNSEPGSGEKGSEEFPEETNAGLYYVWYKVTADGDQYTDDGSWTRLGTTGVRISKANLDVTEPIGNDLTYDGNDQILIKIPGKAVLNEKGEVAGDMLYSLTGTDDWTNDINTLTGKNAADYTVYYKVDATSDGNWNEVSSSITVTISPKSIANATVELEGVDGPITYDGAEHKPTSITVKDGDITLVEGTHYTIATYDATNAGDITVTVNGTGNYGESVSKTYTINQKSIAGATATFSTISYSGSAKTPTPTVKLDATTLTKDVDFTYASSDYDNNIKAGEASLTIHGSGNYSGEQKVTFTIGRCGAGNLTNPQLASTTYTGNEITPTFTKQLEYGTHGKLKESTDYTVQYQIKNSSEAWEDVTEVKNAGDYKAVYTLINNFSGTKTATFTVNTADITITPKEQTIGYGSDVLTDNNQYEVDKGNVVLKDEDILDLSNISVKIYQGSTTTEVAKENLLIGGDYTYKFDGITVKEAYASNFNTIDLSSTATLNITNGIVYAKVKQTVNGLTYGTEPEFSIVKDDTELTGLTNIQYTVKQGETVITKDADKYNLDASQNETDYYTVSATAELPNYTLVIDELNFTVAKKNIASDDVTFAWVGSDYSTTYTSSAAVLPGTNKFSLTFNGSAIDLTKFIVDKPANATNVNAGTASFTVTAPDKSNFTGSKSLTFKINKAPLTITANPYTWAYLTTEPVNEYSYTLGELQGNDTESTVFSAGVQVKVRRASGVDETVGTYDNGLEVYFLNAVNAEITATEASRNYDITKAYGKLTIVQDEDKVVVLKVKDITQVYGEPTADIADTDYDLELSNEGDDNKWMTSAQKNQWTSLVTRNDVKADYTISDPEGDHYVVNGNYTISLAAGKVTSTNFKVEVKKGAYTVSARPLKLKAIGQTITYGDNFNSTPEIGTTIEYVDGTTLASWDAITVVVKKLTASGTSVTKTGDEPHTISFELETNNNYSIPEEGGLTTGRLTINAPTSTTIEIVRYDNLQYNPEETSIEKLLKDNNGVQATVKLKALANAENVNNSYFSQIAANRWYAMVLPFEASVREISNAFGYAVVDRFDQSNSNENDVSFRLYTGKDGKIPANEPFLLQVYETINLIDDPVTFTGVTISYDGNATVSDTKENEFIGTYTGKKGFEGHQYIIGLTNGNISGSNDNSYIPALSAYISMPSQMSGMNNARFFIEEPDGTTTVIRATEFVNGSAPSGQGWYNLNGVKLDGAPTQKGMYIQNGKKVIVK